MSNEPSALGGRATEMFAGIAVSNFQAALDWNQKLFGVPPTFFPNQTEAVWALADHRWIYIIVEPEHAGGTIQTIICDKLEEVTEEIAQRGLTVSKEERPAAGVCKVMYYDPDGNELGIGSIPAE
jgi:hypothetical protein